MTIKSRELRFVATPKGIPGPECFELATTELEEPGEGEVLVQNLYMSVDPAMRPPLSSGQMKLGSVMRGGALGKVAQSRNASFAVGQYVLSQRGFREWFVSDGRELRPVAHDEQIPLTAHLGVLGIGGLTAYGGLLVTGQLKEGETVFVSAAA